MLGCAESPGTLVLPGGSWPRGARGRPPVGRGLVPAESLDRAGGVPRCAGELRGSGREAFAVAETNATVGAVATHDEANVRRPFGAVDAGEAERAGEESRRSGVGRTGASGRDAGKAGEAGGVVHALIIDQKSGFDNIILLTRDFSPLESPKQKSCQPKS